MVEKRELTKIEKITKLINMRLINIYCFSHSVQYRREQNIRVWPIEIVPSTNDEEIVASIAGFRNVWPWGCRKRVRDL